MIEVLSTEQREKIQEILDVGFSELASYEYPTLNLYAIYKMFEKFMKSTKFIYITSNEKKINCK
jgi:hypothetical protein